MEATWIIFTTKVEVYESNLGESQCNRVPARVGFSMTVGKYYCPCFRVFYEKMLCLWNPVLRFKSRYPFWTKISILLKTGTWTFCWTYQSQFKANIWSLIQLIRPLKHPSNWKFSKIKLRWWVLKRVFEKYFSKKLRVFEKIESFFEILESFFEKVESFFEKFESFFEILESFFEILESFFEIYWEFSDAESFLLAVVNR